MYRVTKDFHDRLVRGENPEVYITVTTHLGVRAYAGETLEDALDYLSSQYNGVYLYDGSITYGDGEYMVSKEARVLSYGSLSRTLSPSHKDLLIGYTTKRQSSFTVELDNADREISKLLPKEPFIGRKFEVFVGFEDINYAEHIKFFSGVIDEINIGLGSVTLLSIEA